MLDTCFDHKYEENSIFPRVSIYMTGSVYATDEFNSILNPNIFGTHTVCQLGYVYMYIFKSVSILVNKQEYNDVHISTYKFSHVTTRRIDPVRKTMKPYYNYVLKSI